MYVLATGVAGFIGFHVTRQLLQENYHVIGIDSLNEYYDPTLKQHRLAELKKFPGFTFHHLDITDCEAMFALVEAHPTLTHVLHLAAQAGVRYSLEHPFAYSDANLTGHLTLLECCRRLPRLEHFVYASSSSVYGANEKRPFAVTDRTDQPISLYAATKKSCELMSYSYSHLYGFACSGLRYFTVYGPWGRPDMSAFIFTKALLANTPLPVFNHGQMKRNFTYIDDVVSGTLACLRYVPRERSPRAIVYNIGNNRAEELLDFIETLADVIGCTPKYDFHPLQPGDVPVTIADISESEQDLGFMPRTNIREGLTHFVNWYRSYYDV